jgi:hypothetical protein
MNGCGSSSPAMSVSPQSKGTKFRGAHLTSEATRETIRCGIHDKLSCVGKGTAHLEKSHSAR